MTPDIPWESPAPEAAVAPQLNAAGLSKAQLAEHLKTLGEPSFRATQVFEGLYKHRWTHWEAFTNLPITLRERLHVEVALAWPDITESLASEDGSTKHAFRLADGQLVEGVHMPYAGRTTLCLSSQVGCAMGCTFCATGQMGIVRNLTAAEIVGQVMAMLLAHQHPEGVPINLVFMGMGEPMHNLAHVMAAFALLTDAGGLAIPPRRITVSTCGLVSGIEKLAAFPKRPRLALSLNGTTNEYRSRIMPVNRVWNLEALAKTLMAFPLEHNERITLEYVLLKGVTDSLEDARRLSTFARKFPSKVNLIPFNAHEGAGFEEPGEARIQEFCKFLIDRDITVSVRRSRGQDVAGACGQLVREGRKQQEA
ncbi:MAG: 23S rRNA (adenine(2503)-C(2))-methyltransferase RlmN [Holophaga sp.]